MRSALIGYTGFVGSNLEAASYFTELYNSSTIHHMCGRYDVLYCAGVRAAKWWANEHPQEDEQQIATLRHVLGRIRATTFVLISTVDVYAKPQDVDETTKCRGRGVQPYGMHRLEFEEFVSERFPSHLVIRLPALFGPGLRKNLLFDLLNDRLASPINGDSLFQWYDIGMLWGDIRRFLERGIDLINLATEPVQMDEIVARFFPGAPLMHNAASCNRYDFKSRFAAQLGGANGYLYSAEYMLDRMRFFIENVRQGLVTCGLPYQI